jgi:hypothetical protein
LWKKRPDCWDCTAALIETWGSEQCWSGCDGNLLRALVVIPDWYDDMRPGDNLYTSSMVVLDERTRKLHRPSVREVSFCLQILILVE